MSPGGQFSGLRDYLVGRAAHHWLSRRRDHLLELYPQLVAPAFDHSSVALAVHGREDAEALDWALDRLRPHIEGKTVIDVGANIGNHAIAFAEVAEEVVALEPHPRIFQVLALNAQLAANVVAVPVGASDRSGKALLATEAARHGCSRITTSPNANEQVNEVTVQPLDVLEPVDGKEIGLIKIDVEGHEEAVLRGAEGLLRRYRPIILFEQHPDVIEHGTSAAAEFLRSLGYRHFYTLETRPRWRSSDRLPRLLRMPVRCIEAILFGPPPAHASCRAVERLESRSYPMLIAAPDPIEADG